MEGKRKDASNIKNIVHNCNKSCIECLSCSYNENSQFSLKLEKLFNDGKNLGDIKGKDINHMCGLK